MTDILDDPEEIARVDTRGMLATLEQLPHQIVEASEQALRTPIEPLDVSGLFVCGMGGSAIGGDILID